jgi:hypothetical protein
VAKQLAVLTEMLVRQLFELACTPFELCAFQNRWERFGWKYEPSAGDEFGFWVKVSDDLSMMVNPLGNQIGWATLPFYYWENYELELGDTTIDYERGRESYRAEFEAAEELTQRILSPPALRWRDADQEAHEAMVWAGQHGLMILQQAGFDLQYGMELNFWLERCTMEDFTPETPLIDWLSARNRKLHNEHGFPPL